MARATILVRQQQQLDPISRSPDFWTPIRSRYLAMPCFRAHSALRPIFRSPSGRVAVPRAGAALNHAIRGGTVVPGAGDDRLIRGRGGASARVRYREPSTQQAQPGRRQLYGVSKLRGTAQRIAGACATVSADAQGHGTVGHDGIGHNGTSNTFTVNAGALHHFAIGNISTQIAGTPFNIALTAQDLKTWNMNEAGRVENDVFYLKGVKVINHIERSDLGIDIPPSLPAKQ